MNILRRAFLILLACLSIFLLVACGNSNSTPSLSSQNPPSTSEHINDIGDEQYPQSDPYFSEGIDSDGIHHAIWQLTIDNGPLSGDIRIVSETITHPDGTTFGVENEWDKDWRISHQSFYRNGTLYLEHDCRYFGENQVEMTVTRHDEPVRLFLYVDDYLVYPVESQHPTLLYQLPQYASHVGQALSFEKTTVYTGFYTQSTDEFDGQGFIETITYEGDDGTKLDYLAKEYGLPKQVDHTTINEHGFNTRIRNLYDDIGMPAGMSIVKNRTESRFNSSSLEFTYNSDYQLITSTANHHATFDRTITDEYENGLLMKSTVTYSDGDLDHYSVWEYSDANIPILETRYFNFTSEIVKEYELIFNENGHPVEETWYDVLGFNKPFKYINEYYDNGQLHTREKYSFTGSLTSSVEFDIDGNTINFEQHF